MAVYMYEEFVRDLRAEGDAGFARRVLLKVFDNQGRFPTDGDDHRYHGIDNAWIRYVSKGGIGIRVIFLRKGDDVYLYRAGPHSVEDDLTEPKAGASILPVAPSSGLLRAAFDGAIQQALTVAPGLRLLENYRGPDYLRTRLLSQRFSNHRSITIVSPYLSIELFSPFSPFGKVIRDLQSAGAKVTLLTRPPQELAELKSFERMEADGFDICFHDTVHAKVYLFESHPSNDGNGDASVCLVGSANLTRSGTGIGTDLEDKPAALEELVCELPVGQFENVMKYAIYLTLSSTDIPRQRMILSRQKSRPVNPASRH